MQALSKKGCLNVFIRFPELRGGGVFGTCAVRVAFLLMAAAKETRSFFNGTLDPLSTNLSCKACDEVSFRILSLCSSAASSTDTCLLLLIAWV